MYSNFHGGERLRSIEVVVAFGLSRGFGEIVQILFYYLLAIRISCGR